MPAGLGSIPEARWGGVSWKMGGRICSYLQIELRNIFAARVTIPS